MNYKLMVIAAKIARFYHDMNMPIEVGYDVLSNGWQVEFRLLFTQNESLFNCYQAISLEFMDSREPAEIAESLLAGFETFRGQVEQHETKVQTTTL